ncbi:MAG TPA: right-handed parallel beta-helix repeat-containing protein [Terriglobales bacterium]|nr:right-handed parallel beta-helix repeat-containing protein [Terriglobales bacterium]
MKFFRPRVCSTILSAALFAAFPHLTSAKTLCVVPHGSNTCYAKIQDAVNHAAPGDVIRVAPGEYDEQVTIGIPLSLLGAGADQTTIDATNLDHGVFVDGSDHPGLTDVNIIGFTIENAQFEGVLVVNAADVVLRGNHVIDNDKSPGLAFNGMAVPCVGQPGAGTYETDESGDCGGAIHFVGVSHSTVSGNLVKGNADGLLISDETAESHDNLVIHNVFEDNPLECGIVLASHPPAGSTTLPHFAPHFGVNRNTIAENVSKDNGVQIGGAGVGLFSDGNGPGTVTGNVIVDNELTGNGLGGVTLHTHVGPAFKAPADNMDGNVIVGNSISKNLADTFDTATPGSVGININSGGGGSPVRNTIISHNVIWDEDVDIAVNDPVNVDFHLNNLLGGKIGVANVCAFDNPTNLSVCSGSPDAEENYWGCPGGPNAKGCSTTSGTVLSTTPWLEQRVSNGDNH